MTAYELDTLVRVQEWDEKGETKWLLMYVAYRADRVRIANMLRNNGYVVEITKIGQIKISRKDTQ